MGLTPKNKTKSEQGLNPESVDGVATNSESVQNLASNSLVLAAIGDSRMYDCIAANNYGNREWSNKGFVSWAMALSGQKMILPINHILAAGGGTTSDVVAQSYNVKNLVPRPKYCMVNGDTNNVPYDIDELKTHYLTINEELTSNNIIPIYITALPTSSSAEKLQVRNRFNLWLKRMCFENGYYICDAYSKVVDIDTGLFRDEMTRDNVHPSCLGGYTIGVELAKIFNHITDGVQGSEGMQTVNDVYDAINNPTGNLISNGLMLGTGGENKQAYTTGDVADGFIHRSYSGNLTSVASKEAREDGLGYWQTFTLNTVDESTLKFYPSVGIDSIIADGDILQAECDVEIETTSGGVDYARLFLSVIEVTTEDRSIAFYGDSSNAFPLPSADLKLRYKTGKVAISNVTTKALVGLELKMEAGTSCVVRIGNLTIRKQ